MHIEIAQRQPELAAFCHRYGVMRLEVFGSAASSANFNSQNSDADFLVVFSPACRNDMNAFLDFREALELLLGRPVDLVDRPG